MFNIELYNQIKSDQKAYQEQRDKSYKDINMFKQFNALSEIFNVAYMLENNRTAYDNAVLIDQRIDILTEKLLKQMEIDSNQKDWMFWDIKKILCYSLFSQMNNGIQPDWNNWYKNLNQWVDYIKQNRDERLLNCDGFQKLKIENGWNQVMFKMYNQIMILLLTEQTNQNVNSNVHDLVCFIADEAINDLNHKTTDNVSVQEKIELLSIWSDSLIKVLKFYWDNNLKMMNRTTEDKINLSKTMIKNHLANINKFWVE